MSNVPRESGDGSSRLVALDVVRCAATVLGIVLHAAVSYMPSRMPGLVWPVHDAQTHPVFDVIFWSLHAFRLPVFFLLAGFFAEMQYNSRGAREFIAQRHWRITLPYYLGAVTICPLTLIIFNWGWYLTGRCTLEQMWTPFVPYEPELQQHYFGPAHLWFLADMLILNTAYGIIRREWGGSSAATVTDVPRVKPSFWLPFFLACVSAWPLWGAVHVVTAHNNSFIPDSARCSYFGLYFVAGAAAYRRRDQLLEFTQYYGQHLLLGVAALVAYFFAVPVENSGRGMWLNRLGLTLSATLSGWLMIFGVLGLALRKFTTAHPAIRYLSDATYWLYLCHLPVVGLMQIALHSLPWPPALKFMIVIATTLVIGLASYEFCIRYSAIGAVLHGERRRRGDVAAATESCEVESAGAAVLPFERPQPVENLVVRRSRAA